MGRHHLLVFALLALGCSREQPAAATPLPLVGTEDDLPLGTLPAEQEQLLERRSDGAALFGTVQAAPLYGDPERVIVLRTEQDGASFEPALDGARVLDARFAGDAVVTIGEDHVLRACAGGEVRELDAMAEGPLSVAGTRVAYTRGEMPFFELARVDVVSGAIDALTHDLAPVWSPALSPDGSEVVFVSSASGHPVMHRLTANGELVTLASPRFPTSPRAPRWEGNTLSFEDEAGPTSIELEVAR